MVTCLALNLAGCGDGPSKAFKTNPLLALNENATFSLDADKVTVGALPGYCIEKKLTQAGPIGYLIIMGGCSHISDGFKGLRLGRSPAIISSHISRALSKTPVTEFAQSVMKIDEGSKLSRDFEIANKSRIGDTVYLDVKYNGNAPFDGTEREAIIALQSIRGYSVTHTVHRITGSGVTQKDGLRLAKSIAAKTRALN
jgi:hypothetical protein